MHPKPDTWLQRVHEAGVSLPCVSSSRAGNNAEIRIRGLPGDCDVTVGMDESGLQVTAMKAGYEDWGRHFSVPADGNARVNRVWWEGSTLCVSVRVFLRPDGFDGEQP